MIRAPGRGTKVIRRRVGQNPILCSLACLFILAIGVPAAAQQQKGDASLRIEYQSVGTGDFEADTFKGDWWTTESHALLLSGDYALTDRLTIYAALPYVRKRFVPGEADLFGTGAGAPHDPNASFWVDFIPPDKRFWDDGEYHSDLQDLSVGLMYTAIENTAWRVSPYIGYAVPVSNYPFFAKAAIGQNLWTIPVGVDLSYTPYFSDWNFRGNLAYVFSEKPLDVTVDYWLAYLSTGYWFKPNFSVNVFATSKYVINGLLLDYDFADDPFDFPASYDNIRWWMHDRLLKHRILNLGIGVDYFLSEKYQLTGSYYRSVWVEQTNEVDRAFTVGLTRFFGDS